MTRPSRPKPTRALPLAVLVLSAGLLGVTKPRCNNGPTIPCETAEECKPFTPACAVAECPSDRGYCVYEPKGTPECPCYDGQTGPLAQCKSGQGICTLGAGRPAAWRCSPADCEPHQTRCASSTSTQACAPDLAWTPAQSCEAGLKCLDGACQGRPPECVEGTQQCASASASRSCVNGRWTTPTQCASGKCCGGSCAECMTGEARCADDKTPQRCEACAWKDAAACQGERVCDSGDCIPPFCGEGKVWCERRGRCAPYCDPDRCQALNATATQCTDLCSGPYQCAGRDRCCKTEGDLMSCRSALISDPCN